MEPMHTMAINRIQLLVFRSRRLLQDVMEERGTGRGMGESWSGAGQTSYWPYSRRKYFGLSVCFGLDDN